jgi:hypothetical protein
MTGGHPSPHPVFIDATTGARMLDRGLPRSAQCGLVQPPVQKHCSRCGEAKALDAFPPRRTMSDGRDSHCRACANAATRRWRAANPEQYRAACRTWRAANPGAEQAARKRRAMMRAS